MSKNKVEEQDIIDQIEKVEYSILPDSTTTVCQIHLKNGWMEIGHSACVDPANFNKEVGEQWAYKSAFNKLWPLFGFLLRQHLHDESRQKPTPPVTGKITSLGPVSYHVGTKEIFATPMTRQEYNDYRGWTLPADENGEDEGFLVEYTDGGKPNVEGHPGYVSWSPKDVFIKAYGEPK